MSMFRDMSTKAYARPIKKAVKIAKQNLPSPPEEGSFELPEVAKKALIGLGVLAGLGAIVYLIGRPKKKKKEPHLYPKVISSQEAFEKKNFSSHPPDIVIIHKVPRGKRVPLISPYPLKLETYLRVNNINYIVSFKEEPKTVVAPVISLGLEDVIDSRNCINFVRKKFNLDSNVDQDNPMIEKCVGILEETLYWIIEQWRWVYMGPDKIKSIQDLPDYEDEVIRGFSQTIERAAWAKGVGKLEQSEVLRVILYELGTLSAILGSKKYFLETDKPTEIDCTAFAILTQIIWNFTEDDFQQAVVKALSEDYKNLTNFCLHIRKEYWKDWDLCLNNDSNHSI